MKSRTNFKKRLISVAVASVLTGLGSHAAANDFTISNGALTVSNGLFNQGTTIGANGVAAPVTGIPLENTFGIPNLSFSLINSADVVTPGAYTFKVGLVIDEDSSNRRIEAFLGTMNVSVAVGGAVSGSVPIQDLTVMGRDGNTTVTSLLSNSSTGSIISINNNGTVSFNGAGLISRLRGTNVIFDAIFESFNIPRHYSYKFVIEQTSGTPVARIGRSTAGTFSAFPRVQTTCALAPNLELDDVFELGTLKNNFALAYAVQGQFSVAGASGSPAAPPTPFTETCTAPPANVAPTASINGGNQTFNDTDGVAGESVTLTGVAADSDGTVQSTEWLVGGSVVASTTTATLSLPDGTTTVTFRVTDDDNVATDATAVITVGVPTPPLVSIDGGDRTVADTDGIATEVVSVTGTATDTDGTIASSEWLVGGSVVATGNSASLTLPVGPTVVTFRATDNAGLVSTTTATITVSAPVNTPPVVAINQGSFTQPDTNGVAGETVALSATATDNGTIASTEWIVNGTSAGSGLNINASLNDGSNTITFRATDNLGLSSETSVSVFVEAANTAPTVSVSGPTSVIDSNGLAGEAVSFSADVIDAENNVTSTEWFLNGAQVASGTSANIELPDGSSTVEFIATDAGGLSASASVTVQVGPPTPPTTTIAGGDRTIIDTNAINGEPVVFSGTAADADGTVASVEWFVNGTPAGSGLSPTIQLANGDSVVSIRAVDNVGLVGTSSVNIRVQPPVPPIVTINGGDRTIVDTNGLAGEVVSVTGTARDPDGTIVATEWLIGGSVVATGLQAQLQVPNGVTAVTFRARDNVGLVRTASVNITVRPPVQPVVSINGGDRNVIDTNGLAGETLAFAATAADLDGSIVETTWLVNGVPAGTGLTTSIPVPNGTNVVTFTAKDNVGLTASASVNVTVAAPVAPVVSILGGSRTVNHTNLSGTTVNVSGAASDADGSIISTEWLVGGTVVATGSSATLDLPNGANQVSFRATDNVGASTTTSVTITVVSRIAPVVSIVGGSRTVADTNNVPGENVELTATATDANGTIASAEWLVGGSVVASGLTATLALPDGGTAVTFRATDNDGQSTSTTATVTVVSALPNTPPTIAITAPTSVLDSDGLPGEDVAVSAVATDEGGSVSLIEWQVNGEVVATGAAAVLTLNNGANAITARAVDNLGAEAVTSATITVLAPAAPVVAIDGGSRTIVDTNGVAGEFVTVSATATDSDGTIVSSQWLVGGAVVGNGTSATLNLAEGANEVSFRATDNTGLTSTTSATLTVNAPVAPVVSILTTNLNVPDTNSRAGEPVSLFGTATDADGTIVTSQWLVNGSVVATGLAADLVLDDGINSIEFRATDNSGMTGTATTTVTVATFIPPPTEAEVNQGAQNQRDTAARLQQLIQTNPQAAAAEAGAAALDAAAKANDLRRAAETGSASNSAIANGLGAMSQAVRSSTNAGSGASDQATRDQVNAQAKAAVENSGLLLSKMAENAVASGVGLTIEEEQQVQQAASNLLDTTAEIAKNVNDTDELLDVVNAANRITESNQRLGIPATPELVAKTAAASLEIATKVAAQALAELGSNLSEDQIRTALSANPNALQTVIDSALKIPPTSSKTQVQRNEEAAAGAGANPPPGLVDRLAAASGAAVDPRSVQIGGVNALQAITNLFGAIGLEAPLTVTMIDANGRIASVTNLESGAAQIKVDDATGLVTLSLPGETYAGAIVGVKSVPATVPTGIRYRADGRGLIVNGGFAIEIAPAPISLVKFVNAVERSGFPFRMNPNVSITLEVGNGERFSGTFAYDNLTGIDLAACGDISFIEPTGALNSAGYAFGVQCANGAVQHVVPFIESPTFNDSVRAFGLTPSTDRNTGFVTVPTVGVFKPNFFVLTPTPEERVFHAANKDAFDNAVQYLDVNGDGKLDVKLITANGTQLLFGIN